MSMDYVQRALMTEVKAAMGTIPTSYENEPFQAPSDAKWGQVHFMPNIPSVETLGAEGEDIVDGIVQIDLNYPVKTGSVASREDFDKIRDIFSAGSRPVYSGQEVVILRCGRSQGRVIDGWYRVSITIAWYALIWR